MIEKIRNRILGFINSDKDTPLLAGFSVGIYMILFYYSKNFGLANSLRQLLFFSGYYVLLPVVSIFCAYKIMGMTRLLPYRKHFLYVAVISIFSFYLLQISNVNYSKKIAIVLIVLAAVITSVWVKKYYKFLILLLLFLSLFNIPGIIQVLYTGSIIDNDWRKMPDDIENVIFAQRPNIYYIQPDGYTSASNFKNRVYGFNNTAFEGYLNRNGFKIYESYRSNYYSTLLSNSSMFSMRHHYAQNDIEPLSARDIIIGDNPVLRILKKNGYKTSFITEAPYLIINRPKSGYDFINIGYNELPFLRDGMSENKDVLAGLKKAMAINGKEGNFYFVEYFNPSHITNNAGESIGAVKERTGYLARIATANRWLKNTVSHIVAKDPDAILLIGADHGGFVGFEYMGQSLTKTDNPELIHSIFGAQLAIRWNSPDYHEYDTGLKTAVNLYRTVFSFLAKDMKYLLHHEKDDSYMLLKEPSGLYKYIDGSGAIIFEKQ